MSKNHFPYFRVSGITSEMTKYREGDFMLLLKVDHISVEKNGKEILHNASIDVYQGEHIALIGRNGIGKTTLVKALLGEVTIKQGSLTNHTQPEDWGCMEQAPQISESVTTRQFVEGETPELSTLRTRRLFLEKELHENASVVEEYGEILQQFIDHNGYEWEITVEKQMNQCGLPERLWEQPFTSLSGGQKTRAQLARLLVKGAKFLILDEPTNHLDVETSEWLAHWIQNYRGAVLIISHDRRFIDQVAHTTYELAEEGTRKYRGGYADYKEQKELEQQTQEETYRKQEQEKRELVDAIRNYRQWFKHAHDAAGERDPYAKKRANKNMTRFKAKEKALERLEEKRVPKPKDEAKVSVTFDDGNFESKTMLTLDGVTFGYDHQPLFHQISFSIERQDRLAIIGRNGTGKTTLLKLLSGDNLEPQTGEIKRHPKLKIGYFMQELDELPLGDTILDYILSLANMTQSEARTILACFLFPKDDVFKKIKDLSMGEKCRVAFVKLYFSEANLLVLDEPTNYLDITTREQIENALEIYPGAVVVVSHDQYLLKKIANKVIALDNGFDYFPGNYKEWQTSTQSQAIDFDLDNKKRQLELLYTQLIAEEIPEDDDKKQSHLDAIKRVKQELEALTIKKQ